jgi:hypothetical protein
MTQSLPGADQGGGDLSGCISAEKHLFIIIWICYFLVSGNANADPWYKVRWVDDGDSIVLQDGRHVRYIGINAPEIQHDDRPAEPFGYKAKSLFRIPHSEFRYLFFTLLNFLNNFLGYLGRHLIVM